MKLVLALVVPLMLALIFIAEDGFRFLFGDKWLPAVPFFQILALASIVRPLSEYNLNILKVKGRSDIFLKIEILKKTIGIVFIVLGFNFGVMGLVISLTVFSFISYLINMFFSGALISYTMIEQIKDSFFFYLLGILVYILLFLIKGEIGFDLIFFNIIFYMVLFFLIYFAILYLFERDLFKMVKNIRKN